MFCHSQIKNYIITGLVSNFFMHLVTGWHLLCRKEITINYRHLQFKVDSERQIFFSPNFCQQSVEDMSPKKYFFIIFLVAISYEPSLYISHFSQYYDIASHTSHVVCFNFINAWQDLPFKIESEWQIFKKLFMAILSCRSRLVGSVLAY